MTILEKDKLELIERLEEHINTGNRYIQRMEPALQKVHLFFPLSTDTFDDLSLEQIGLIDVIVMRFSKLQDLIGAKVFPLCLILLEEDRPGQSAIDVFNKLEKLELLPSAHKWRELRKLRNTVAHEYAENNTVLVKNINNVVTASKSLIAYWKDLCTKIDGIKQRLS